MSGILAVLRGPSSRPAHVPLTRGGFVLDMTIAIFVMLLQLAQALNGTAPSVAGVTWTVPLAVVSALALAVRRRYPTQVALIAVLSFAGYYYLPAVVVASYTLGAYARDRRLVWSLCPIAAGGALISPWIGNVPTVNRLFTTVAFVVSPALLGLYFGARRSLVESLHERAARLERERGLLAHQAIVEERTRIAREMHDVLAHRVSLMVLHAGALEISPGDGERTTQAAGLIRSIGRDALEELREVIGVLRVENGAEEVPLTPQPTVDDVSTLVEQSRAAGTAVSVRFDGPRRPLSRTLERTAYRVVQEALTNVHKHARDARTEVVFRYSATTLEVSVANEPPCAPATDLPPGGHGLVGLGERVRLVGGRFAAGPRLDGGFAVTAVLPATDLDPDGPRSGRPVATPQPARPPEPVLPVPAGPPAPLPAAPVVASPSEPPGSGTPTGGQE